MKRLVALALVVVFLFQAPTFAGTIVPKPEVKGDPESSIVGLVCPDGRLLGVNYYDLDKNDDVDLHVWFSGDMDLVFVYFAPGPEGEPVRFIVRLQSGAYAEVTRDELAEATPCDIPLKVKDAPTVNM